MNKHEKILFFGYGNLGRQDDGLGVRLAEALEEIAEKEQWEKAGYGVDFDANYQLNVEDALLISEYDVVIFADASLTAKHPFQLEEIGPAKDIQFTTHAMHPTSVLALCHEMYKKYPRTFLFTMPGTKWEMSEEMSEEAQAVLAESISFMKRTLTNIQSIL